MDDLFDNPAYRITKMALQLLGLWPYQKSSIRKNLIIFMLCDLTSSTVAMIWYFIDEFSNTSEMVNCIPALCMAFIAYSAYITGIINFNKFKNTLDLMKITWTNTTNAEEKIIFKKYAKIGRIAAAILFGLVIAAASTFSCIPLISKGFDSIFSPNESKPMLHILKVNFYGLDSQEHYHLINLHNFQATWLICILTLVYDFYYLMVIHHGCSMFAILSDKIKNVGRLHDEFYDKLSERDSNKILCNEIKSCIRYHWECIKFCQSIEDSLKYLWLMEMFVNSSMITVMGVQTIVNITAPIHMLSFALNTSGTTAHLFCFTWASQKLLNHSEELSEHIYNIDWHVFPQQSKKLLFIMLLRNSRPCKVTAGGMIDLNLETFARLMKISVSYFTLVLSTQ